MQPTGVGQVRNCLAAARREERGKAASTPAAAVPQGVTAG
jgi:hypothetical protein